MNDAMTIRASVTCWGLYDWLGMVLGIAMPVIAALLYPTYMHRVDPGWAEWTRLLELSFFACELVVIRSRSIAAIATPRPGGNCHAT